MPDKHQVATVVVREAGDHRSGAIKPGDDGIVRAVQLAVSQDAVNQTADPPAAGVDHVFALPSIRKRHGPQLAEIVKVEGRSSLWPFTLEERPVWAVAEGLVARGHGAIAVVEGGRNGFTSAAQRGAIARVVVRIGLCDARLIYGSEATGAVVGVGRRGCATRSVGPLDANDASHEVAR